MTVLRLIVGSAKFLMVAFAAIQLASSAYASGYYMSPRANGRASGVVPYLSSLFYSFEGGLPTKNTFAGNAINCSPGFVRTAVQPTVVGTKIWTASSGGKLSLAIYSDLLTGSSPSIHRPFKLLAATGDISTTTLTTTSNPTAGQGALGPALADPLSPGALYWKCAIADNSAVVTSGSASPDGMDVAGFGSLAAVPPSSALVTGLQSTNPVTYTSSWPVDLSSLPWTEVSGAVPDFAFQVP